MTFGSVPTEGIWLLFPILLRFSRPLPWTESHRTISMQKQHLNLPKHFDTLLVCFYILPLSKTIRVLPGLPMPLVHECCFFLSLILIYSCQGNLEEHKPHSNPAPDNNRIWWYGLSTLDRAPPSLKLTWVSSLRISMRSSRWCLIKCIGNYVNWHNALLMLWGALHHARSLHAMLLGVWQACVTWITWPKCHAERQGYTCFCVVRGPKELWRVIKMPVLSLAFYRIPFLQIP